jgi:hypothetical protein
MNAMPNWRSVEILVTRFLYPGDRYYELQDGAPFCTKAYLDEKRARVETHELRHHELANLFWGGDGGRRYEAAAHYDPTATEIEAVRVALQSRLEAELDSVQTEWDRTDYQDFTCRMRLDS